MDLRAVMQKLRRPADSLAVGLYQSCAYRGLRFGTAAGETMGDQKDIGARSPACRAQAISAAASVTRPSAERQAATMLFVSSPAIAYICSGLA